MEFIPCHWSDFTDATCSFAQCKLPSSAYSDDLRSMVLVVAFNGAAGNTHEHIGTFAYMDAMIVAGLETWQPTALILDLRRLRYWWGDEMHGTLSVAGRWCGMAFPTAVVVSDLNRDALTSLVKDEIGAHPSSLLFESLEAAVMAVDRQCNPPKSESSYGL